MKLLNALQPYLVNIWAFLGGGIVGLFTGAALVSAAANQKSTWEILNSELSAGIIGGVFTAIITGSVTYFVANYISRITHKKAIRYKILIFEYAIRYINNIDTTIQFRNYLHIDKFNEACTEFRRIVISLDGDAFKAAGTQVEINAMHDCAALESAIRGYANAFYLDDRYIFIRKGRIVFKTHRYDQRFIGIINIMDDFIKEIKKYA